MKSLAVVTTGTIVGLSRQFLALHMAITFAINFPRWRKTKNLKQWSFAREVLIKLWSRRFYDFPAPCDELRLSGIFFHRKSFVLRGLFNLAGKKHLDFFSRVSKQDRWKIGIAVFHWYKKYVTRNREASHKTRLHILVSTDVQRL